MKDVHIALSGGCVRLAYPGEKVLDFSDNLSFGPLCALDDEQGLQDRTRWFQKLYHSVHAPEWDISSQRLTAMENLKVQLAAVSGQVTLWIGDNPDEQLMLRALLPLLAESAVFVVNVTELTGCDTTGSCPIETLESLWIRRRELTAEDRAMLIADWHRLLKENAPVRIFTQGGIQGKTQDFHDPLLLQHCPKDFTQGSRVVGNAMVNSPYWVGDTFLNFRLYALIDQGVLQAQTGGVNMNRLQVRQV
ncbi:DUF1835 domain-containing protein [Serratia quinivorans]|uniref:DUF1835 domain-containing protein n=1 Tax=Serratia quinivorans TaxID=137545 RepID=UPI002179DEEC|nr:DUF1835 domain-containing protein [Serratia quinivorans]CAI0853852.1 Protein of uncharacterised function [Serratia quinivorans]CAI0879370.1 Protein of uncharacterised function [Serratia quinivorans]CAI1154224.1 Protein of uncharacterised function [Serratia quinivorans]CAI1502231.1 Protein of uncharacterised function [Serratia quinivorans]CAI2047178.1 Protein of uncharacterised function [Serratia quinivorans]